MFYKPVKAYGGWVGLIMGLAVFGFCLWGINFALEPGDKVLRILLFGPAYLFLVGYLYVLFGAFNMGYKVESDGLSIVWGFQKRKLLWSEIEEVVDVKDQANFFPYLAIAWWGYMVGAYNAKGIGSVRMYATHVKHGFICLKTTKGFFGITPADHSLLTVVAEKSAKVPQLLDMAKMSVEEKGEGIEEDDNFRLNHVLNLIVLAALGIYLAVFFPGSGAPRFIILLLVLALALYIFNIGNAKRIYLFAPNGAHAILLMQLFVTGAFLILAVWGVSFR